MECDEYTPDNTYNECVQSELLGSFENLLGCQPPLLAQNLNKMCNERFNRSADNVKEVQEMFRELNLHDTSFKCKRPCTTNIYKSRLISKVPSWRLTGIVLVFDLTLSVTHSTFSINGQTFLTRLGGSVSSGRTLLWILVTLLGAPQVIWQNF